MARNGGAVYRYQAYRRRKRRNGKGLPRWAWVLIVLGGIAAVSLGVTAGVGYGIYQSYADDLVPPDEIIAQLPLGGARIFDRNGNFLYEFLDDGSGLRDPVPLEEISQYLVDATVATEDVSFWDNPGVNIEGLTAAAWDNFWPFGGSPGFLQGRGGSSITQQLVKNVYFTQEERATRSVKRKVKETVYALELTDEYSKEQIMEWYLNQISYGNVFVGVEAASQGYFGKAAKDLTLAEAATLAAIPSCPTCYDPINRPEASLEQRNRVLRRMHDEGYLGEPGSEQARALLFFASADPLAVKPGTFPVNAPHFVFNVVQPELERLFGEEALRRDGLVVHTSLDLSLQKQAQQILEEWITTFESSGGHNGAVVAIDPKTAELLVYVGSRDYFNEEIDGQNDMAAALNSPGSAFKPFTYVTAFMELGWGPGTMVLDTPFPSQFWDGERPPRNPGTGFQGPLTLRNALGSSLNIPAVKTIMYTGVLNVIEQATKMGITGLVPSRLGPSMTIGGVDVKLIDMVYGYTAFPNLGVLKGVESTVARPQGNRTIDPAIILRVEDRAGNVIYPVVAGEPSAAGPVLQEVRVAPEQESYLISNILSDGCAQSITFGGCGALSIPGRPLAIKTGTSEPYADILAIGDTWAIGYTPQLVVGSWFGNADNSPMTGISSTSVSWRTVRDLHIYYHQDLPVESFTRPAGLVEGETCVPSGLKPTDACLFTTPSDLFAAGALPEADDTWWQTVRIDTRTGLLASEVTPEQYVTEQSFLGLPEGLSNWEENQALEWAEVLEASADDIPTEETQEADIPAIISSPAEGASVSGMVSITGRARSADFLSYRLEFQSPAAPGEWLFIAQRDVPVADGPLGTWNTVGLAPGLYTIRLVLGDAKLGFIVTQVEVLLGPAAPTPIASPLPTAKPG